MKQYYRLTKPGIIYGNLLSAVGGFLLASQGHINLGLFIAMASGTVLVIGAACVTNNIIDQDIDAVMARTKKRPIVSGEISVIAASIYAVILGCAGIYIMAKFTNGVALSFGLLGLISYVGIYTFAKRYTVHATLIGSISGATPIAAGYTAVTGRLDLGAILLFAIMVIWQMPHFYAIAMYRKDDYAAADIPVLSLERGMEESKRQIVMYVTGFVLAVAALALYGYASFSFFILMTSMALYWLWHSLKGVLYEVDDARWARKIFGISLLQLLTLSLLLSVDVWLP